MSPSLNLAPAGNVELDTPASAADHKQISAINYDEFLRLKLAPRETLLTPWLPKQGIAMAHAARGIGKTHFAHGVAWAVATGGTFLCWSAGRASRVLLLDGEMPGVLLQERFRKAVNASGIMPPAPGYMRFAISDLHRDGLPDLADTAAQQFYADIVADADLVVVDNLSTLCRSVKENEADSWAPVQDWCLGHRRQGRSILLIHHDGKNGSQRGTSKKEDVLDSVIGLRRPPGYQAEDGARFEIHFEKARGFFGPDAEPFEAKLIGGLWQHGPIHAGTDAETLVGLRRSGMSVREIARRTNVPRSTVQRRVKETR